MLAMSATESYPILQIHCWQLKCLLVLFDDVMLCNRPTRAIS